MKKLFLLTLFISNVFAESRLACWNMYSPRGSSPIMTAKIGKAETLEQITFDFGQGYFEAYFLNKVGDAGERWGHKKTETKSELVNPQDDQRPEIIVSNHSPYKGNNEYSFVFGSYSFKSPYYNTKGKYTARLILPTDLSSESLKNFRIRSQAERSNAVVVLPPPYDSNQSGNNYLRMFCTSK